MENSQRGTPSAAREMKTLQPAICASAKTGQTTHTNGKTSPVQLLESAMATRRKSQTELSNLTKLLADKSARLAALEKTGDLHDAAVISEIGRLQIFAGLLPHRIAATEEADANRPDGAGFG